MKTHLKIFTTVLFVFACCAFLPQVQAATDTPDPGAVGFFNTADGFNALSFNASGSGFGNSAFGWFSGWANQDGNFNTSAGAASLDLNNGFSNNTALGAAALLLSQGDDNTAVGAAALENNNANGNTAMGSFALFANMTGNHNAAVGFEALELNMDAFNNTAMGGEALLFNDGTANATANNNTAVGWRALRNNLDAGNNTAVGSLALLNNDNSGAVTANNNTAVGFGALLSNVDGDSNTAVGSGALNSNTTIAGISGISNNAIGRTALVSNTTGSFNEAMGVNALVNSTTSNANIAIGDDAMFAYTGDGTAAGANTAVGFVALSGLLTGTLNTAVGQGAGANYVGAETSNILIGSGVGGTAGENNTVRIGTNLPNGGIVVSDTNPVANAVAVGPGLPNSGGFVILVTPLGAAMSLGANLPTGAGVSQTFIGGIVSSVQSGAGTDTVNIRLADGRIGHPVSSRRYKEDIKPMDKASEALFALKPVTFRYKKEVDPQQGLEYGLIAEDVAKIAPELAVRNPEGEIQNVRYQEINAMLLNEFLKEHRTVQELKSVVAKQEATNAEQQKQIEALTAGLQKVSAQIEVSKPAPQVVTNKP